MKKHVLLIIIVTNYLLLFSQTIIPEGYVTGNWYLNGSPYLIEGEITVPDGETLSIDPGVMVEFQGHFTLNVQGQLLAIGSIQDSIKFTICDTTGFHLSSEPDGAWNGIHFNETPATNDSSKIVHCILKFSKTPVVGTTDWNGGAIFIKEYSKVLVSHCLITNNKAQSGGGICINWNSSPIIDSNVICNNANTGTYCHGGGICIKNQSNPLITNNLINNNILTGFPSYGGGVYIGSNSEPILTGNVISENWVESGNGGGINVYQSNPIISGNIIDNNSSGFSGGGIHVYFMNASPIIKNNLFIYNTSPNGGAISFESTANPLLINNTLTHNLADNGGGIWGSYIGGNSNLISINCILYGNYPEQIELSNGTNSNVITLAHSIVEGGESGVVIHNNTLHWLEGNLDVDPLFIDESNADFRLQDYSPAIGSGIDSLLIDGTWYISPLDDLNGEIRPNPSGSLPDIGAYENPLGEPLVNIFEQYIQDVGVCELSNYPNPFNPSTTIEFSIQNDSNIDISIFNIKGQRINNLAQCEFKKGFHSIIWNGDDDSGKSVSSGIYYYKLKINGKAEVVKKCLLLK